MMTKTDPHSNSNFLNKITLLIVVLLMTSIKLVAQNNSFIAVSIVDNQMKIIPSGMVTFNIDSNSTSGKSESWSDGVFKISKVMAGSRLFIKFSSLGYKPYHMMLSSEKIVATGSSITVLLEESARELNEVTISSVKKTIEVLSDKIVFNVANSGFAVGGTADELLRKTPHVITNNDGSVSMIGKGKAQIYLNGMLISTEMLKSIPSGNIDKIEVITNAGAKYDASGAGIINLTSQKNNVNSTYLNADASVTKGKDWRSSYGIQTGLLKSVWSLDVKYRFYPSNLQFEDTFDRTIIRGNDTTMLRQKVIKNKSFTDRHAYDLTTVVNLNKTMSVSLFYTGNLFNGKENDNGVNLGTSNYSNQNLGLNNLTNSKIYNLNNILNYEFLIKPEDNKSKLSFSGNNTWYRYTRNDNIFEEFEKINQISLSEKRNDNKNKINLLTFKTDYYRSLGKVGFIEGGFKYSKSKTSSQLIFSRLLNNDWIADNDEFNSYNYNENISAGYISGNFKIDKFAIQTGLRAEQTKAKGESQSTGRILVDNSYLNFFPNINLQYALDKDFSLNANYQKRINRPLYQDLNPYKIYIDSLSIYTGNPLLKPEIVNSFETGILYKKSLSLKLGFSHTANAIKTVVDQLDPSSLISTATFSNLKEVKAFYVNLDLPYQVKFWTTYNAISYTKNIVSANLENTMFNISRPFWTFYSYNQFKLSKNLLFELTGVYNTAGVDGIFGFRPKLNVSSSIKTTIKENFTIGISANDIFNTDIIRTNTRFNNFSMNYRAFEDNSSVRLSLSYRIGKKKSKNLDKRLDQRIKDKN